MITVDEALAALGAAIDPLQIETISTGAALGRVLAAAVPSAEPLPRFDQSAVDGYAVDHSDLTGVPVSLPLGGVIAATGYAETPKLAPGTAARIFTGGVLPTGADAVVRQELTRQDGDVVHITESVAPGADMRRAGDELAAGALVGSAGSIVTPGLLGALASIDADEVNVRRLPRVRVLVTGDEVVPLGTPLRLGEVPDVNGPLTAAHLARWGAPPLSVSQLADRADDVRAALDAALDSSDLVITTGGVSVGDYDFVPSAAEDLGADRVLWKVAQRPGMPLYVARRRGCLLIGLPGNPGAVVVNLHVYVRFALDLMLGLAPECRWLRAPKPPSVRALPDKTFWLRAKACTDDRGQLTFRSLDGQASHMITNLADADALVRIPPESDAATHDTVAWTRLTD
ncbi:MAG: molybdopterin molybdotransferase MoeA [Actinobacteria bacterium]|nr:molybdopterin molybdotransferase MoeA [Actinomycetota bacterium]